MTGESEVSIVSSEALTGFIKEVFVRAGVPAEDAATQAKVFTWANLRGVDSHGVTMLPIYIERIDAGVVKPKPNIRILNETPATLLIDADCALGTVVTTFAMERAIEKAKQSGIGWALISNHNHQGAMGYYPLMAAERDMAGITWACSLANMVPYGGKSAGVANNPIAISVPAKRHRPLIFDMATSVAAGGKILLAIEKGIVPEGWVVDKNGNPTTDPTQAAFLVPIGGAKGSGLALMMECLASVMTDKPRIEPVLQGKEKPFDMSVEGKALKERMIHHIQNSVVVAIDIGTFTDVEVYKEHIDNLIDGLKALTPAEGFEEVLVPGEPENKTFDERSQNGIPIPERTVLNLRSISERLGVTFPIR